jgi:hypothetical protein
MIVRMHRSFYGAVAVISLLMLATGCRRGARGGDPVPPPLDPVPTLSRIYYDNSGGIQDSVRLTVRDPASLERLWKQATAGQTSPPPVPRVDFRQEMVLVVGAGRKTPEDQIRVDSVGVRKEPDSSGRMTNALAAIVRTLEGCRRFKADAYPVEILRVKRFEGPVIFIERREQASGCR